MGVEIWTSACDLAQIYRGHFFLFTFSSWHLWIQEIKYYFLNMFRIPIIDGLMQRKAHFKSHAKGGLCLFQVPLY